MSFGVEHYENLLSESVVNHITSLSQDELRRLLDSQDRNFWLVEGPILYQAWARMGFYYAVFLCTGAHDHFYRVSYSLKDDGELTVMEVYRVEAVETTRIVYKKV